MTVVVERPKTAGLCLIARERVIQTPALSLRRPTLGRAVLLGNCTTNAGSLFHDRHVLGSAPLSIRMVAGYSLENAF
jgi:hypothetical protein